MRLLKFITGLNLVLLILFGYTASGQSDSLSLEKAIERVQSIVIYPEALNEGSKIHKLAVASSCQSCKVSSFIMMGKVCWVDGRYKSSIDYFKKALGYLPGIDSLTVKSSVYTYIALNFYYQGYYDSALYYHEKSLQVLKAGNNFKKMPRVLNHIALVYHRKGDYSKSLEYLFKMEKILEEFDDHVAEVELWGGMDNLFIDTLYFRQKIADNLAELKARLLENKNKNLFLIYYNLGRAHSQVKENLTAARYWKQTAELMEKQNLIPYWNDVGASYREANMKDSCFFFHYRFKSKYYDKCTRISKAETFQYLGEAHYYFGNYDSALNYFERSFRLNFEMNNRITLAALYRRLADTHFKLHQLKEAEAEMLTGLALANEVSLLNKRNLLKSGINIYQASGEYSKALNYSMAYTNLSDSLSRHETLFNLVRLQAEYQTAKKERDVKTLQGANIQQQLKLHNRNTILISLAAISFGFLGFIVVLFVQRANIRKKNQALDLANQEQTALLKEVHHRVKNNLQLIASLINLQSSHVTNAEVARELEKTRSRIMSIALIHKKLYQHDNISSIDLQSFLRDLIENILATFSTGKNLAKSLDIASVKVDIETAISMGLIVNELVTNSLKHGLTDASNPTLSVKLVQSNDKLVLTVSDNGSGTRGSASQGNERGFGLKLVEILLKRLSGTFETSFQNGNYSRIEIANF